MIIIHVKNTIKSKKWILLVFYLSNIHHVYMASVFGRLKRFPLSRFEFQFYAKATRRLSVQNWKKKKQRNCFERKKERFVAELCNKQFFFKLKTNQIIPLKHDIYLMLTIRMKYTLETSIKILISDFKPLNSMNFHQKIYENLITKYVSRRYHTSAAEIIATLERDTIIIITIINIYALIIVIIEMKRISGKT